MIEEQIAFQITLNGVEQDLVDLPSQWRLIDYLHEVKGLTGTKLGCGAGYCKACTVAIRKDDGHYFTAPACSTSVKVSNGWDIYTVESLGNEDNLHPLQEAVVNNYAFQCGYCTPGFLMEGFALYENFPDQSLSESNVSQLIDGALESHLCRCTGYKRYQQSFHNVLKDRINIVDETDVALHVPETIPETQLTANPKWELIRLLHEAAEVENSLMLQYLYAAFSIKRPLYAGLAGFGHRTPGKPLDFLAISIEEMAHLDTVNRLIVELGGSPNLVRQDFPWEPSIYPFPFSMEPLSKRSVAKYLYVEATQEIIENDPEVLALVDELLPDHQSFNRVGGLYTKIRQLLSETKTSYPDLINYTLWDQKLAIVQSEGEEDHYLFFRSVLLGTHPAMHGTDNPWSYPIDHPMHLVTHYTTNPTAFPGFDHSISGTIPRAIAMLSNRHYWVSMALLELSYRTQGAFHPAVRRHMAGPLLQLCWHLPSDFGVSAPFDKFPLDFYSGNTLKNQCEMILAMLNDINADEQKYKAYLPEAYLNASLETRTELFSALSSLGSTEVVKGPPSTEDITKEELLITTINRFAEINDSEGFMILTEHPTRVDVGESRVSSLFAIAPINSIQQILDIRGIGSTTVDAMIEAIEMKLADFGESPSRLPTLETLQKIIQSSKDS